uniref:PiggyBac transposable element-derived protein domain-containing protein n=1 Tax=Glossina austeni TaxID=7395 RepID=A0A1A9UNL7_GLOAU
MLTTGFDMMSIVFRIRDKFRNFLQVRKNVLKQYIPGSTLTIDEPIPSKPGKYVITIFWIRDSGSSYPLKGLLYLVQERTKRKQSSGQQCVQKLSLPFEKNNYNIEL